MKKKFTKKPVTASTSQYFKDLERAIRRNIDILFLDAKKLKETPYIDMMPENFNYLSNRVQAIERQIDQWHFRKKVEEDSNKD